MLELSSDRHLHGEMSKGELQGMGRRWAEGVEEHGRGLYFIAFGCPLPAHQ